MSSIGRRVGPGETAEPVRPRLLRRREQTARLLVRLCRVDVEPRHRVRRRELLRRPELAPVDGEGLVQLGRREVRGEGVGKPERRSEPRPERARAEDPERHVRARPGNRGIAWPGCEGPSRNCSSCTSCGNSQLARRVASQRPRRELVGSRRAAETEVDPAGVERLERPELLRDHERRVVREHDPARADADRRRARRRDDPRRPRSLRSRSPACCGARPPSGAGSRAAPRDARGRGCCGARRPAPEPSVIGARSRTESGTSGGTAADVSPSRCTPGARRTMGRGP